MRLLFFADTDSFREGMFVKNAVSYGTSVGA